MRVLLLSRPLHLRGATIYTLALSRELRLRGHKVAVMGEGGDLEEDLLDQRIPLLRVPLKGDRFRDALGFFHQVMLARQFAPDVIHAQDQHLAEQTRWLSSWLKLPYLITVHRPLVRALHRSPRLQRVIATTPNVAQQLVRKWGLPETLVDEIPMGIRVERDALQSLERPMAPLPVIGTVGYVDADRGLATLVRAAREVRDAGKEAHFLIVGTGPGEGSIRRLIRELDLVDFVTVSMARARPTDLFDPIDIFVSTFASEGLPVSTLVAMTRAKPVIALPSPLLPPTLIDGETALVAGTDSPTALAESIMRMLDTESLRHRLARRALEVVTERHPLNAMIDRTVRSYRGEANTANGAGAPG